MNEDDFDDDMGGDGAGRGGRGKRRARELYDAFAGESDENLFSDEDEGYRDEVDEEMDGEGEKGVSESSGSGSR